MSATQDKSQKVAFVYSNLYEIYRKGKSAAQAAPSVSDLESPFVASTRVLKSRDVSQGEKPAASVEIHSFTPIDLIGKRVKTPDVLLKATSNPALDGLKNNLKTLNDLHSRLRFLLKELEDLVKKD